METTGRSAVSVAAPPGRERALAGASGAVRLFREVVEFTADPTRPLRAVVCGQGGSGKSVLLGLLADVLRDAGIAVVDDAGDAAEPDPQAVVLLDDVQDLDEPTLDALRQGAARPGVRIVVAHRPLSGAPGLPAFLRSVEVGGRGVLLGPLGRAGVADRAAVLLAGRQDPTLVEHVLAQTAGQPRLVDRLLTGLREAGQGGLGQGGPRQGGPGQGGPGQGSAGQASNALPAGVLRQVGADVATHPVELRRLLLARALGAPVDPAVLAPVMDVPPDDAAALVDRAVAAGLLLDDGSLPPLLRLAVLTGVGVAHRAALHRRVAEVRLARGGDLEDVAHSLVGSGLHGSAVAAVLEQAADDALRRGGPAAGTLYDAAVAAGAPALDLADRRAEAALTAGDLDAALGHADQVLTDRRRVDDEQVTRAVAVAAAALAHRGLLARSAELYRWSAASRARHPPWLAVPALIGIGALDEAEEILSGVHAGDGGPPTVLAGAGTLVARGVHDLPSPGPRRRRYPT